VEGVTTSVPQDEIGAAPIADVRAVSLEQLPADADVRRNVIGVMETMEGPSRVPVAMFQSAI
jgi:hypothetical protein